MEIIAAGDIWQIKESARFEIGEKEANIKFHWRQTCREIFKSGLKLNIAAVIWFHQRRDQNKWEVFFCEI